MWVEQSVYPKDHEKAGQLVPDGYYCCFDPTPKFNKKPDKCVAGQDPFNSQDAVKETCICAALCQNFGSTGGNSVC